MQIKFDDMIVYQIRFERGIIVIDNGSRLVEL